MTENRYCELLSAFGAMAYQGPRTLRTCVSLPYPMNGHNVVVDNPQVATETHHICGSSLGAKRSDSRTNTVRVCRPVHEWLETHKLAGLVLCCYRKRATGELDWQKLSKIKGVLFPSCLDTDAYRSACEPFLFIERMRLELLSDQQKNSAAART